MPRLQPPIQINASRGASSRPSQSSSRPTRPTTSPASSSTSNRRPYPQLAHPDDPETSISPPPPPTPLIKFSKSRVTLPSVHHIETILEDEERDAEDMIELEYTGEEEFLKGLRCGVLPLGVLGLVYLFVWRRLGS